MNHRTGIGYDIHRTAPQRPLILGGVKVEHNVGLVGHSDADVVLHALCDALLGAAALGDIGELFPDTDPSLKDADSRRFVAEALTRVNRAGFRVVNVDLIIQAERPKLGATKGRIRESVAAMLELDTSCVSIKAGTNEGQDAIGRGDAIACWAVATVQSG